MLRTTVTSQPAELLAQGLAMGPGSTASLVSTTVSISDGNRLERIARLARRTFDVPIALIVVDDAGVTARVDSPCQAACLGLPAEMTEAVALQAHGLVRELLETRTRALSSSGRLRLRDLDPSPVGVRCLLVSDARVDPHLGQHPLVAGPPHVRFFAGVPLCDQQGRLAGSLCLLDRVPRTLLPGDRETLGDLQGWAEDELALVRMSRQQETLMAERDECQQRSLLDPLTALWNRRAILELLDRELSRCRRKDSPLAVVLADVDHFKNINDTYGHLTGDVVLRETSRRMRAALRPYDALGRYGGEEFLFVLSDCDLAGAESLAERVRDSLSQEAVALRDAETIASGLVTLRVGGSPLLPAPDEVPVTVSLGVASYRHGAVEVPAESVAMGLIGAADAALYAAKAQGRNRVARARYC
jgi:diguanylate cyclase (GGDEF)-like protein